MSLLQINLCFRDVISSSINGGCFKSISRNIVNQIIAYLKAKPVGILASSHMIIVESSKKSVLRKTIVY